MCDSAAMVHMYGPIAQSVVLLVLILLPLNQKLASKPVSLENLQQCSQKQAVISKVKIWLQTPTYWKLYNPTSWITKVTCSNIAQYPMKINQKHLLSAMLQCRQNEKLNKKHYTQQCLHIPVTAACPVIAIQVLFSFHTAFLLLFSDPHTQVFMKEMFWLPIAWTKN